MKGLLRATALVVAFAVAVTTGCYRGGGRLFTAVAATAIITAAIVSSQPPPPPRVVYVPEPRPGYTWQPGYWTLYHDQWEWVPGRWIAVQPGYQWTPTHWEQDPDGQWHLIEGHWTAY
jgi:hypothetical protein